MWIVVTDLNKEEFVETFKEACKKIIIHVKKCFEEGGMTFQTLETTMWIVEKREDDIAPMPKFFYDVRDACCDNQWIDNQGNWIGD